ncbi:cystathionine beta-synthase (CBS) family protein [Artemisia annua]|uniref:Cystathionine beta-synthase (CBS) family protein n=1 Tax=Artemisia annua TaxID=35608 RepID=A0A2U1LA75_ARTAN|nr:cystathionine beta-synthase (CBS) family protein [Artemisia annua]
MASVFLYHVVGDLTVGKPEMIEFTENETVEAAIRAIGESTECGIAVWKRRSAVQMGLSENAEMRHQRFVGILNPLDIVAFLAKGDCLNDQDKALKTPVSEVVVPDKTLLKEVDPGTRLIDALEIMKNGVRRLLVPKSIGWRGMSKRFSILYNGKWLKNIDSNPNITIPNINRSSSSTPPTIIRDKYCCLSREDVIRFLIGCLGALAPLPLSSISSLGAVNPNYCSIEASSPAIEAALKIPREPSAFAVVEPTPDGQHRILGEISASKLWKCDYLAAAWALANLSAGQFVTGVEDNLSSKSLPDLAAAGIGNGTNLANGGSGGRFIRQRTFSSRSIGFFNHNPSSQSFGVNRSMYRGRSVPLTCKATNSLAAVMAQMLSHRATHVWVTETENDDVLVGLVGYADILAAVTRPRSNPFPEAQST